MLARLSSSYALTETEALVTGPVHRSSEYILMAPVQCAHSIPESANEWADFLCLLLDSPLSCLLYPFQCVSFCFILSFIVLCFILLLSLKACLFSNESQ